MDLNLVDVVREAGVVGAGGAGFPTYVKLQSKVDTLIVNAAECEPLLRVDQQLLEREGERIISAADAARKTVGASDLIVGIKAKYKSALASLEELQDKYEFRIFKLDDYYPAGDEVILIYDILGRIVPAGGLPLEVGVVVMNAESLLNVSYAIEGQPVTEKYLTIAGQVFEPVTLRVPVGILLRDLLAERIDGKFEDFFIITGGPMMCSVANSDDPVTKTTKGVIVLPSDHPINVNREGLGVRGVFKRTPQCDLCRYCTDLCPYYVMGSYIQPHLIMQAMGNGIEFDADALAHAYLCRECGVCEIYACPVYLPVRQMIRIVKSELQKRGKQNPYHLTDQKIRPLREFRRVPTRRIIYRLGLSKYDVPAPLVLQELSVDTVYLPLKQHIGAPSEPTVKVGDMVNKGDLVARIPNGSIGSNIHASISGFVREVSDKIIISKK
ncbi:MAG: 4Fe-4S dicluster domain-containing protein [Actinobacteria bacterium]|nr:4Fe-4S dicluster domain-containing protein [Actinomycetota bacterium]